VLYFVDRPAHMNLFSVSELNCRNKNYMAVTPYFPKGYLFNELATGNVARALKGHKMSIETVFSLF
jgi:hypothetical protein